jgi:hypothetical protein
MHRGKMLNLVMDESNHSMKKLVNRSVAAIVFVTLSIAAVQPANAAAVRSGVFNTSTLPGNDDSSTGLVNIGFDANFFGTTYNQLYVNNNGNVTFNTSLAQYTPFGILNAVTPILAPFFADVDTRNAASGKVTYGTGTIDGRSAFGVNWPGVGYFSEGIDKLNTFQLVLLDRSDIAVGNFDIEFNYDQIQWETGRASGGSGGLGGNSARAGYSNGAGTSFEFVGSGVNGAFLDSGSNSLIANRLNSGIDGRYLFTVRDGAVVQPGGDAIPTPALLPGLIGLGAAAYRKRKGAAAAQA